MSRVRLKREFVAESGFRLPVGAEVEVDSEAHDWLGLRWQESEHVFHVFAFPKDDVEAAHA